MKEIERRWLLCKPFDDGSKPVEDILVKTHYLSINKSIETRVRQTMNNKFDDVRYVFTVKAGSGMEREEVEVRLFQEDYINLLNKTYNNDPPTPICKEHKLFIYNGFPLEVNIVDGKFTYAEIEFRNETEARAFQFPQEFIDEYRPEEVTGKFSMSEYWLQTRIHK